MGCPKEEVTNNKIVCYTNNKKSTLECILTDEAARDVTRIFD